MKINIEYDLSFWEDEIPMMAQIASKFRTMSKYDPDDSRIRELREDINEQLKDMLKSL
ncbi:hypothetical protein UT300009_30280 [Paraclostridium bifermentans]